ncbi:uncharacterized protein LOC128844454 [Malaclemys terrapin pileata]|uniref:uncharacterized protein LOC128844454 n=1 Tax=Malaclemys terrapin pileata TaxID=2991368 RepID=UPI0023A7CFD9|nr:uncharacterized protein LOC128844454 [Malaclemys terrapin pileata]
MYFLVILTFLGRITGETFFHHYENGNFTLTCNETVANGKKETVWYESRESLHEFQIRRYLRPFLQNHTINHLVQEERSNITLSCEFQMKPSGQTFLIYWIKYTETSKCLSSVQRKEHNFSYNTHCCIDEMIKGRLLTYTSLDSNERHVVHNMTILNVTYSDSGTYLCVVNAWSRGKHVWKIANNLSIEVRNQAIPSSASSASIPLYATTGLIVGIIIISGIAWLIYKKKIKSKGKPSAQLPRYGLEWT